MKYLYLGNSDIKGYDLVSIKPKELTSRTFRRLRSKFILTSLLDDYTKSNVVMFEKGCKDTYYLFTLGVLIRSGLKTIKLGHDGYTYPINEATKVKLDINNSSYEIKFITKRILKKLEMYLDSLDKVKSIDIDIVYRSSLIILGYLYSTKYASKLRPNFKTKVDYRIQYLFKKRFWNAQSLKVREEING